MDAKRLLKKALSSIDDAVSNLQASNLSNDSYVQMAISDLDDAESEIKRAISELPDD